MPHPDSNNLPPLNQGAKEQKPDKLFLSAGSSLSYGKLEETIHKLSTWYRQKGMTSGQRTILACQDDQISAIFFLSMLRNGLVPVLIDPELTDREFREIIEFSEPEGIVADVGLLKTWNRDSWISERTIMLPVVQKTRQSGNLFNKLLGKKKADRVEPENPDAYPHILEALEESGPGGVQDASQLAYILFTSGTTSRPKGVEISHGALMAHLQTLRNQFGYNEQTRLLNLLPLNHVDGMIHGPVLSYFCGASLFRPCQFQPQSVQLVWDTLYAERITHFLAVPTMFALLIQMEDTNHPPLNCEDLQCLISTGAGMPESLWKQLEERFQMPLCNFYGMTETVTGGLFCGPDSDTRKMGTVGKPVDCEIRIVDDSGAEVSQGTAGELWIRGANIMTAYHRAPDETQKVLRDGWLVTGDLAQQDPCGFVSIVGRKKNLIITGGRNVNPEEVARVLCQHEAVATATVVGLDDPVWGESVSACVVPGNNHLPDETSLIEFSRKLLAPYKVPRQILIVDELPKGKSGKVALQKVKDLFLNRASANAKVAIDLEQTVFDLAASSFNTQPDKLNLASRPENTPGWDSFAHMNLIMALEQSFNISLNAREVMGVQCLEDAVTTVRKLTGSGPDPEL